MLFIIQFYFIFCFFVFALLYFEALCVYPLHFLSGELIGVQYLFQQTGVPQDIDPASLETQTLIEEHSDDVDEEEGFSDLTDHDLTMPLEVFVAQPL